MTLKTYKFASGVDKENTRYANEGRWWSMDKMRFRSGTPEKIGGWQKAITTPFLGAARALFNWMDLDGDDIMAIGTNIKLYGERGQSIFDITPAVQTRTHSSVPSTDNCIQTFNGTTTVRVNITAHAAVVGSYVVISGVSGSVGGIPASEINGEHVVTAIPSANYFEIEVTTAASSSTSGGGVNIRVEILLENGVEYASGGTGWGAGTWGRGGWGSGTTISATSNVQLRLWFFDNFGENLLANVRGGEIYYWRPSFGYSSANRAISLAELPGAAAIPLSSNYVVSTDERHIVAFGTNAVGETEQDPLLIRWCDQEDPANWLPSATNSAGDIRVPMGSEIVAARQTRQEILVWTDASLHSLQYIGAPYTFSLQTLTDNCSLISPNAQITVNNITYWMGTDKFYAYSGRVETLPCSLRRFVYSDLNRAQSLQIQVGLNEQYGEIMWFYCSALSNNIDKYVVYNYLENIWYYGTLNRTVWLDTHLRGAPFACSNDGYMYQQEFGCDDGSTNPPSAITAYIESADFDIDDGDKFSFVKRIIPDITFQNSTSSTPSVVYTLSARNFPGGDIQQENSRSVARSSSAPVDQYTNQVWIRVRGRQAVFRVESTDVGVMWQLGANRLDIRPDGRR
jgi:hypothetical protein